MEMEGYLVGRKTRIAVVEVNVVATGEGQFRFSFNESLFGFMQGRFDYNSRQGIFVVFVFGADNGECNTLKNYNRGQLPLST